jgi:Ca-activated chloride channel homolog
MSPKRKSPRPVQVLALALIAIGVFFAGCCALWAVIASVVPDEGESPEIAASPNMLQVAYSPEKQVLFEALVQEFNAQQLPSSDKEPLQIQAVMMDPDAMVQAALAGEVQAIAPDSSIWLDILDREYAARQGSADDDLGTAAPLTTEVTRWAVSPVVIAVWEDTAREMGWPETPIGWKDILERAGEDRAFKWSHPSTSSASGLLATLAQFYAGADATRGLTEEMARSQPVVDYVSAIQKTVRFYGEGEWAVVQRALQEGPSFLDAFVVQEQMVIYVNQQVNRPGQLVAVYPAEGTLWEDHPLALVETSTLTPMQRQIYGEFSAFLRSPAVQQRVLAAGYRPADLSVDITASGSPISAANGVDPAEPQTTLQMPSPSVIEIVRDVWWLTKRHTNVYLVVDTSGSMYGSKLENVQEALMTFIGQIKGDTERVGLVAFSSSVYYVEELDELQYNRERLISIIGGLEADGDTAMLDGVAEAYSRLQYLQDEERINAIVVMTDGRENSSYIDMDELERKIQQGNATEVPVVIFCIAYGSDADTYHLQRVASASGGQVRTGDLETIRNLYKTLSTYF